MKFSRLSAAVGGAAILAMIGFTAACGSDQKKAPETTKTTTTTTAPSSAPTVAPTEKSINPTGGNLFTPSVAVPTVPTSRPGN